MYNLLLVEHDYQVQDLLSSGLEKKGEWIALGPSAMGHLDDIGIDYRIPEEFFAAEELAVLCEETHRQVEFLCDRLDEELLKTHPALREQGMFPFRFNIFPLTALFDGVRGRMFQLNKLFNAHPDVVVYVHRGQHLSEGVHGLGFSNSDALWGSLASLPGWGRQIKVFPDPGARGGLNREKWEGLREAVRATVGRSVVATTVVRNIALGDVVGALDVVRHQRDSIVLLGSPNEWRWVMANIRRRGWRLLFVEEELFGPDDVSQASTGGEESLRRIETDPSMKVVFEFAGVGFYELFRQRLWKIWRESPLEIDIVARKVAEAMARYRVKAIVRNSCVTGLNHVVNQAARMVGIPVFTWQHGFVGYYTRVTQFRDYCDLMTSSVAFVYGSEVERAYTRYGRTFGCRVIPVGSPSLDAIRELSGRNERGEHGLGRRPRVLYATTNYYRNSWYFGAPPGLSDLLLYRDQLAIVRALRGFVEEEGAHVTAKLHPSASSDDPPWAKRSRETEGIRFIRGERSFVDLLGESDVAILDIPSTTLLQAIAAGLPVFVLMRHWQYPQGARSLLAKRAFVANEAGSLVSAVRDFLRSEIYPANIEDTGFIEAYGTYLHDGKSRERTLDALVKEIEAV